jgi:hypothetical protein
MQIRRDRRNWLLPMRMSTDDYAAFREILLHGYYDYDLGEPQFILDLGGYCGYTAFWRDFRGRGSPPSSLTPTMSPY